MELVVIIIGSILMYVVYQLQKRLNILELGHNRSGSFQFVVDGKELFEKNQKLALNLGFKSAAEGKEFKKWPRSEQEKWIKHYQKYQKRTWVRFNYLASEDAYFIASLDDQKPYITSRGYNNNDFLYSAVIAGDDEQIKPYVDFQIYERNKKSEGIHGTYISVCLSFNPGRTNYKNKEEFEVICEFPIFDHNKLEEKVKELGFKIEDNGGDYTDSFGDLNWGGGNEYIKNGVTFRFF